MQHKPRLLGSSSSSSSESIDSDSMSSIALNALPPPDKATPEQEQHTVPYKVRLLDAQR